VEAEVQVRAEAQGRALEHSIQEWEQEFGEEAASSVIHGLVGRVVDWHEEEKLEVAKQFGEVVVEMKLQQRLQGMKWELVGRMV
jgi:formylmethanofuran dehydrogenase subunit D